MPENNNEEIGTIYKGSLTDYAIRAVSAVYSIGFVGFQVAKYCQFGEVPDVKMSAAIGIASAIGILGMSGIYAKEKPENVANIKREKPDSIEK